MLAAGALAAVSAPLAAAPAGAVDPAGYVWAGACKECHAAIYASWEKTKHARAITKLDSEQQQKDCIQCHVTGAKALVLEDGKPLNAGVQCEACHGPGAAHAADPAKLPPKVRERDCTTCHSDRSPHFRGFVFSAMAGLCHPVKMTQDLRSTSGAGRARGGVEP